MRWLLATWLATARTATTKNSSKTIYCTRNNEIGQLRVFLGDNQHMTMNKLEKKWWNIQLSLELRKILQTPSSVIATLWMYPTIIKRNTTIYILTFCYPFFYSSCRCLTTAELMYKLLHVRRYILSGSEFRSRHRQVSALSLQVFRFLDFRHFHL